MTNVLVTGGAGFIGSHLCTTLLNGDNIVSLVVIDNFLLGSEKNVSHLLNDSRLILIQHDINDISFLSETLNQYNIDTVFHLAANSDISVSHTSPSVDYLNTFNTTWSVLEAMRNNNCKNLVFASTSAIYGESIDEIDENYGPIHPISHYGAGKLASEAFISSFSYNYNINTWLFRFPNVVGGRSTHGIIYDFLRKLKADSEKLIVLGNGTQEKSYLHVSDLVNGILFCKEKYAERYNTFNVGGLDSINVKRIAEIVIEETKSKQSIHFTGGDRGWIGDVPKVKYNTNKIKNSGWQPALNSEMAIRTTVRELIKEAENDNK
ncbi:MAG: NAD-dependent epimerase/dehydratase family protein [Flavobacterium sp.]|nr:NAD-dependent epimerase/dehydratase family protein [Flavobacterium sp.]